MFMQPLKHRTTESTFTRFNEIDSVVSYEAVVLKPAVVTCVTLVGNCLGVRAKHIYDHHVQKAGPCDFAIATVQVSRAAPTDSGSNCLFQPCM